MALKRCRARVLEELQHVRRDGPRPDASPGRTSPVVVVLASFHGEDKLRSVKSPGCAFALLLTTPLARLRNASNARQQNGVAP
jgi:hypothetical protein